MHVIETAGIVLASSSGDSGDLAWVPLLFLLSGPVFFMLMYTRYRNTDKRHTYERDTASGTAGLQQFDNPVDHVTGSRSARMPDANHEQLAGSPNRGSWNPLQQLGE